MHDYHMDVGILGSRALWHVLAEHGMIETALRAILNPTFPSFKCWLDQGATALFEAFTYLEHPIDQMTAEDPWMDSLNHHCWGDIVGVFMRHLAGIQVQGFNHVQIAPCFTEQLNRVSAHTALPLGSVCVQYKKTLQMVDMTAQIPAGVTATLKIPHGYRLCHGSVTCKSGENHWIFCKE
jgi:alpha-L-rhamnosidase